LSIAKHLLSWLIFSHTSAGYRFKRYRSAAGGGAQYIYTACPSVFLLLCGVKGPIIRILISCCRLHCCRHHAGAFLLPVAQTYCCRALISNAGSRGACPILRRGLVTHSPFFVVLSPEGVATFLTDNRFIAAAQQAREAIRLVTFIALLSFRIDNRPLQSRRRRVTTRFSRGPMLIFSALDFLLTTRGVFLNVAVARCSLAPLGTHYSLVLF